MVYQYSFLYTIFLNAKLWCVKPLLYTLINIVCNSWRK